MSSTKEERDEMAVPSIYIAFIGYYDKFDWFKDKTKVISGHKGILKYLTQ